MLLVLLHKALSVIMGAVLLIKQGQKGEGKWVDRERERIESKETGKRT